MTKPQLGKPEDCEYAGLVVVWTSVGVSQASLIFNFVPLCRITCMPLRFAGIHICLLPEYFLEQQEPVLSLGRLAMDSSERHRYRTHTGSLAEIKYKLQTFGIPVSALPLDDSGVCSSEYNRDFMTKQRMVERQSFDLLMTASIGEFLDLNESNGDIHQSQHQEAEDRLAPLPQPSSYIGTPGKHDVLMGRGRSCQEHAG